MKNIKFSAGIWIFGGTHDRFGVYKKTIPLKDMLYSAIKVPDLSGIEFSYPTDFQVGFENEILPILKDNNLEISVIGLDLFGDSKWQFGSFVSPSEEIRKDAIETTKRAIDVAFKYNCDRINLWLAQDGYDYPFQVDYNWAWEALVEGIRICCDFNPQITICLEYKIKEPRTHSFLATCCKGIYLCKKVGKKNCGITVDIGHTLMAYESMAETISILDKENLLAHLHLNDNYRLWDDDMLVGSVHFLEYVELLYCLEKSNYNGWYSLDVFPYRDDAYKVCSESIEFIKGVRKLIDKIGVKKIEMLVAQNDYIEVLKQIRNYVLP